jgi:hypothetical protein
VGIALSRLDFHQEQRVVELRQAQACDARRPRRQPEPERTRRTIVDASRVVSRMSTAKRVFRP